MTPATSLAGGLVAGALVGLFGAHSVAWLGWLGVLLGALAPHVLRHRAAHGLLAALGSSLLWIGFSWLGVPGASGLAAGWGAGYLSHLFLDAMTVQGVVLFWPSTLTAVLPKPDRLRIEPGTPAERRLRWTLCITAALLIPLQAVGVRRVLHQFIQTPQAAEEDYLRYTHEGRRVLVWFEGFHTTSQRSVAGTWDAIHAPSANTLLLVDPMDHVHRLGNHPTDTIRAVRVRALRGEPVQVEIREITLRHQALGTLLDALPEHTHAFLTGWAVLEEPIALTYGPEEMATIALSERRLEFTYAPLEELTRQRLTTIEALRANFIIRLVRSRHATSTSRRHSS